MKNKIKKSIVSVICILSVLLSLQIPAYAAVIDSEPINSLPSYYSSKDLGYTTSVRNQSYGNCWAYASTACLETLMLKNGNRKILESADVGLHLSPTHMAFSTNHIKQGGSPSNALHYLDSWTGPKAEKDFPQSEFFHGTEKEKFKEWDAKGAKNVVNVNGWMDLTGADRDTIKTAIYKYGSVEAKVHLHDEYKLNDALYANVKCNIKNCKKDHALCVIGWNDNYAVSNFKKGAQPKKPGAWLCKNSQGDKIPGSDYLWVSYEDIYFTAEYAITDYQLPYDNTKIYQNQIQLDGGNSDCSINFQTYVNVFDFSDNYTTIDKINFESSSQGAEYTIYNIPLDSSSVPNPNKSTWKKLYSGTIGYNGLISADIKDFTVKNGKCAIGIKINKNESDPTRGAISYSSWSSESNKDEFLNNFGKSYIIYENNEKGKHKSNPEDLKYVLFPYLYDRSGSACSAFVIKAVAKKINGDVNGDGKLSIQDITMLQRYLAKFIELDTNQLNAADYDGNGKVNISDVTAIQRHLAGYN